MLLRSTRTPLLSVVVPFYNVSAYLARSLTSLRTQRFRDFEVVLVDDGSEDDSASIARELVARDRRFRLVSQPNSGPGPARNHGIAETEGRYLAFADGDDEVPHHAYDVMVASLESTGSDIACGRVIRFLADGRSFWSPLHAAIGVPAARRTTLEEYPALVANRTMWNQVYRRDFWESGGLRFGAVLYEDVSLSLQALVRARAVDVLPDVVYRWRMRGSHEAPSITSRDDDPELVVALMRAVARVNALVQGEAPGAKPTHDRLVLDDDFMAVVAALPAADRHQREQILGDVRECVSTFDPATVSRLTPRGREQFCRVLDALEHSRTDRAAR